jgi:hypothetical protein
MFSWPANRVKPKMKATYTRKKPFNSLSPSDHQRPFAQFEANNLPSQGDNSIADDDTGHDSMDVAPRSNIGSGIQSEDNSTAFDVDTSLNFRNSALVANAVAAQLRLESTNTEEEMLEEEDELYDVEGFMADGYKMV